MKALNTPKHVMVKYPRNTPRISRKRDWMDRSEWRKDPQELYDMGNVGMDMAMDNARNTPVLEGTPYRDLPDLMERSGRATIRRF